MGVVMRFFFARCSGRLVGGVRWRGCIALLALMGAAQAGELAEAKGQLTAPEGGARRAAIKTLVKLDNRAAVDVLIGALRRAFRQDAAKARAFGKVVAKSTEELTRLCEEMQKIAGEAQKGEMTSAELGRQLEALNEIGRRASAERAKVNAAKSKFLPHLVLTVEGAGALGKFQSRAAVARIEEIAQHDPPGRVRNACLRVLADRTSADVVPTLCELAEDKDPRVRSLAVRALLYHVERPGVLERLAAATRDEFWQVRRGAYEVIATLLPDQAGPLLEQARQREVGDQERFLSDQLRELRGEAIPAPQPVAFGLPLTSQRVRFVLDLSETADLRYIRRQLALALDALPDGALLEIVGLTTEVIRFASTPLKVTASTRRRARSWLGRLKVYGTPDTQRLLDLIQPSYHDPYRGKRVFAQLPDTIYLVLRDANKEEARLQLASFALWNDSVGAVLHVAVLGKNLPRRLFEQAARETGGFVAQP